MKIVAIISFLFCSLFSASQQPLKDSVAKYIQVVDSIALNIDSSASFSISNIHGGSDYFGLFSAIAFRENASNDLKKLTADFLQEQVTFYCSNGIILKIQEQKQNYYPIITNYYNQNGNKETDVELLKKMKKYIEVFENINTLVNQK